MKRIILSLSLLLLGLGLAACGEGNGGSKASPTQSEPVVISPDDGALATASPSNATPTDEPSAVTETPAAQTAEAGAGADERNIVGTWAIKGAEINGAEYIAGELVEMAEDLGDLGAVFSMQLTFNADGSGEMSYGEFDLGDVDLSTTWKGEAGKYSMTDSAGDETEIDYDTQGDTFTLMSNQTKLMFERVE